ncbi:60S ribosomal protein L2, mitochondrial precursor [Lophiotrema nucula]|uniref:Large ribosomal subunit protein bL27m n=1 Tax=Lophiotrema nucula TaxID=690887 RepID=A0A6A5Z633_9PLEO|nr:60S ribosomal protein L2, mitochondrial precursor [Lophiotrema nucula]
MLLPRIFAPLRASIQPSKGLIVPSLRALDALRAANGPNGSSPALSFVRYASHQAQGRANGAKQGPGKRLGAKKSGGEYVNPGHIIFRQRGTGWFPGENCAMGRDHCIYATEAGYVRYYRDPLKHPKRQYIGVCFEKHETLPYPPNAVRRRRLNMLAVRCEPEVATSDGQVLVAALQSGDSTGAVTSMRDTPRNLIPRSGYGYREANWSIGRAAERAGIKVKEFVPGDRWRAWQRSKARIEANVEKRKLRNASKKTGKSRKQR